MTLARRKRLLAHVAPDGSRRAALLRGFHAPQRERVVLGADEPPQHGVGQPMPPRKPSR